MVLETFIIAVWGFFVAFIQERFGKFNDLPANVKQLINAVLAFIVPAVVVYLQPYWLPEFGNINEVVTGGLLLFVPVVAWLASQIGHQIDRLLQKYDRPGSKRLPRLRSRR